MDRSLLPQDELAHFRRARLPGRVPGDQLRIPKVRLGFCCTLDELVDLEWIEGIARARPAWNLVHVGARRGAAPSWLGRLRNLHLLGDRPAAALPAYVSDWDVALLPYRRVNAARLAALGWTRRLLAAGRPVVAPHIPEVAHPFGCASAVEIATPVRDAVAAIERSLALVDRSAWLGRVDQLLAADSDTQPSTTVAAVRAPACLVTERRLRAQPQSAGLRTDRTA